MWYALDTGDTVMTQKQSMLVLLAHRDPVVRSMAENIQKHNNQLREALDLVQEALEQVRFDMVYIALDLEATRRERDELRKAAGQ
jgi:uncharacterized protein (DUF3084 family)